MLEIASGVVQLRVLGAQVWLLLGEPLTLIDTGTRGSGRAVRRALERLGRRPDALASIVLTHYHPDHAGSLPELLGARGSTTAGRGVSPSAQASASDLGLRRAVAAAGNGAVARAIPAERAGPSVAIHASEAPFLAQPALLPNPFHRPVWRALVQPVWPLVRLRRPCPVDVPLADGDPLPGRSDAYAVHLPGHTPGSIAVYLPDRGVILAGDAMERRRGVLGPPSARFTENAAAAWASIRRLGELDFDTLCLSHFPPIRRGAAACVRALGARGSLSALRPASAS